MIGLHSKTRVKSWKFLLKFVCFSYLIFSVISYIKNLLSNSYIQTLSTLETVDNLNTSSNYTEFIEDYLNVFSIRKNYTILENFVQADLRVSDPNSSITYLAHGEYTYLDNIVVLMDHWDGPVSISIFAPGSDFVETLRRIYFLQKCIDQPKIKQLVSFHLYYPNTHAPSEDMRKLNSFETLNCSGENEILTNLIFGKYSENTTTYRKEHKLMYPINLGRNIAQEQTTTKYVLGSDLELYPAPLDLIPKFLKFVKEYEEISEHKPTSYVLPAFEVEENITTLPSSKTELQYLYSLKLADFFHRRVCWYCHFPPNHDTWINMPENGEKIGVFHKMKKHGYRWGYWEPFSITLKNTPPYDERLMKEMFMDRVPREYAMCLLNYDYVVLDDLFLIHKPGIRKNNKHKNRKANMKQFFDIRFRYKMQYLKTFGNSHRDNCFL